MSSGPCVLLYCLVLFFEKIIFATLPLLKKVASKKEKSGVKKRKKSCVKKSRAKNLG
jgi:hypothetical protein